MIQVLGAIAYGEWKAHDGARREAELATDPADAATHRKIAAEELRHHKGFVRALVAMGADPERAMAPYRGALDSYHATESGDPVEEAMWSYLGEGIADDLLEWLRTVVDGDTEVFVESVIADEEEHEALAVERLRTLIATEPDGRARAGKAARSMITHMLSSSSGSGRTPPLRFLAFLRAGRPHELLWAITSGYARRLRAVGLNPLGLPALPSLLAR